MRALATIEIPLYRVVLILTFVVSFIILAASYFRVSVSNYQILITGVPAVEQFNYGSWPALANPDFYLTVKAEILKSSADLIEVDLGAKLLTLYRHGTEAKTFPILAIGKKGSWWETPAGLYKIQTREKVHFSSFAGVYSPWSLPFQGNFFIHGWPYYPDGTPVSTSYSGGCVRLSDDDAKFLYDNVKIGTPVLVRKDRVADTTSYALTAPAISARNALAGDLSSNFVLFSQSSTAVVPIASVTKLVTALVATEYINLDKEITVTPPMIATTSKPRLWVGETLRGFDLMYPLLLESSNEAAAAFSETLGNGVFIAHMNEKAHALGMLHTHFVDAAGVEEGNMSTAEDIFLLLKHLWGSQSFFLRLTSGTLSKDLPKSTLFAGLENFNIFAGEADFVGGKVGKSSTAKEAMASVFTLADGKGGVRPIAIIVLQSDDNGKDTATLLDYVKSNFLVKQ